MIMGNHANGSRVLPDRPHLIVGQLANPHMERTSPGAATALNAITRIVLMRPHIQMPWVDTRGRVATMEHQ